MAIQSNHLPLPFELAFWQGPASTAVSLPVHDFKSEETQLFAGAPAVKLKENLDLRVRFASSDPHARLYMDGLDALTETQAEVDAQGRYYLPASSAQTLLFTYEDYPLIPGFYRLEVTTGEERYFAILQVEPKQMSKAQWEIMRDELEQELRGLALDLIKRNLGFSNEQFSRLPPKLLHRFMVIRARFPSVMAALSDLLTKVNYQVRKDYRLMPADQAKGIDSMTLRHRATHPELEDQLLVPVPKVDYDLLENRWVRQIVRAVTGHLSEFMEANGEYVVSLGQEVEHLQQYAFQPATQSMLREKQKLLDLLSDYQEAARKMNNALQVIRHATWYDEVSTRSPIALPQAMMSDVRYQALHRLYRELRIDEFELVLDSGYSYQWKRTDQLYEIWCYLQLCKTLTSEMGFSALSGWLFDLEFDGEKMLIPTLPAATKIVLQKDDITLHLAYDAQLPRLSSQTDGNCPLYTVATHNRPDGRLDIYKDDVYAGSLLCDFKYRPLKYFWDKYSLDADKRPHAMNQIISYSSQCRSPHLYGASKRNRPGRHRNPVLEAWALYPSAWHTGDDTTFSEDYSVRLVRLSPGGEHGFLRHEFERVIADAVNYLNDELR